MLKEFEDRSM